MSTAPARAIKHTRRAVVDLEQAKAELPEYAIEAVILARAELKVSCRRLENLQKAIDTKNRPAS